MPARLADVDLSNIPVLDAGGNETFVAHVFADNYFELYVNGTWLAVDAVPFTPFNSSVIRFRASRPVTIALMLVDRGENPGLGSERGRGHACQPGDDNAWPRATTCTNATAGEDNKRACMRFTAVFDTPGADARFIWSSNLILDNLVLVRKTFD